jgi:hypothetical protein
MNKLVEYLYKYHNPGGNSVNIVSVDDLIFEMELTRAELFDLATDPEVKKMLTPKYNVKDWSKWHGHKAIDLVSIAIWNKIYWTNQWLE